MVAELSLAPRKAMQHRHHPVDLLASGRVR